MAALLGAGLLLGTSAQAQTTERVSVASDGGQGNDRSVVPAISADGRFVAFISLGDNLVPGDTNGTFDIFVHDRDTGTTERVNVASDGTQGNDHSFSPAISADGRFVAFRSCASNLVLGDTNGVCFPEGFAGQDIFVHDRVTGTTERVSVASDGTEANDFSSSPAISADGRFVAFPSRASNLFSGDSNGEWDIFVHDRDTGITEHVSVASDGTPGNDWSFSPAISADGRFVAFSSQADNLVPGDSNGQFDTFVHDRVTGTTERVSVASDGMQGNADSGSSTISADGRFVAFLSTAGNLVLGDTNGRDDIFVHDRDTGITERVSVASDGTQENANSRFSPAISADGRFVAFDSFATNLVPGDTNGREDIFVHDRVTGTTERVNVHSDGTQANQNGSQEPDISADGRFVAFYSAAKNLVDGDTNDAPDIFVHDRGAPPQLSLTGACPGSVSLSLSNATPDGLVAFAWGTTEGSVTLPPGPCAGTKIGLAEPSPLDVLTADQSGGISLDRTVGAGVCGLLVQAVDVTTCGPSNVASVP